MRRPARRGFTLIEILVVLAIMAILAGLLVNASLRLQEANRRDRAWAQLEMLAQACEKYQGGWGGPPPLDADPAENFEVCRALTGPIVTPTGSRHRPLNWPAEHLSAQGAMIDPWGTPYRFKLVAPPGGRARMKVWSCGPNKIDEDGNGDDLPPQIVAGG